MGDTQVHGRPEARPAPPRQPDRGHRQDVVLVTDAARSRVEERDERQRRYLWSMGVRTLCFILAVALLHGWAQWLAIAASLVLPWVAVIVANAGPKRLDQQPAFFLPTHDRALGGSDERPPPP